MKPFKPSADALKVLAQAKAAGQITAGDVADILALANMGDAATFNDRMSALAREVEYFAKPKTREVT